MQEIRKHIDRISQVCDANKVKSLFAFGSAVSGHLHSDSDIDLVVDIDVSDPLAYSDYYFKVKFELEELFKRRVDLLEHKAIRNPYLRQQIDRSKVLLYGK